MTEKLKQIIKEETTKLSKEAQGVISTFGWEKTSEEIGKKYLLNEGEINDLQVETLLILVGLVSVDEHASNIENNISTSKNEAEKISEEIIQKIFIPISESISKKIGENFKNKKLDWDQTVNFIISGGY